MLRVVHLKNFNRFYKDTVLKFDEDSYFFVGENGSGKTSIFEAVKRCLSTRRCRSFENIGNPKDNTYISCEFEFPVQEDTTGKCKKILSALFHLSHDNPYVNYKIAVLEVAAEPVSFGVNKIEEDVRNHSVRKIDIRLVQKDRDEIYRRLKSNADADMSFVLKFLTEHQQRNSKCKDSIEGKCEEILRELDESVVILLERQGFSSFRWSEGDHRSLDAADILTWYKRLNKNEKEEAIKHFRTITDNFDYSFSFDEDQEKLLVSEHDRIQWDFLITPGGFVEAKQCSILLAMSSFHTLCLEEVAKGMHTSMVHRLRDFVLPNFRKKGKVVILATHTSSLLSSDCLPRTFVFQRRHNKLGHVKHKIIEGKDLANLETKSSRIITDSNLSRLFFCRKALFVEGKTDSIFVRSLVTKLFRGEDSMFRVIRIAQSRNFEVNYIKPNIETEMEFLTGLEIIKMDGSTQIQRMHDTCEALDIQPYFLLDKDAFYKDASKESKSTKGITKELVDLQANFGIKEKAKFEGKDWYQVRELLMQYGIYGWKDGSLEDMVFAMFEDARQTVPEKRLRRSPRSSIEAPAVPDWCGRQLGREDAEKKLEELNFTIRQKGTRKGKSKARHKLFASKDLTDKNISEGTSVLLQFSSYNDDLVGFVQFLVMNSRSAKQSHVTDADKQNS